MIALIYFMKLFDIEYFNKISERCKNSKSSLAHFTNASPLYIRVIVVPIVSASLCVCAASYMPHWILMGIFLIDSAGFIVLFLAGTLIANQYTMTF